MRWKDFFRREVLSNLYGFEGEVWCSLDPLVISRERLYLIFSMGSCAGLLKWKSNAPAVSRVWRYRDQKASIFGDILYYIAIFFDIHTVWNISQIINFRACCFNNFAQEGEWGPLKKKRESRNVKEGFVVFCGFIQHDKCAEVSIGFFCLEDTSHIVCTAKYYLKNQIQSSQDHWKWSERRCQKSSPSELYKFSFQIFFGRTWLSRNLGMLLWKIRHSEFLYIFFNEFFDSCEL